MNSNDDVFTEKIRNTIAGNVEKSLGIKRECLGNIIVASICRQNRYSTRSGGKCTVEYQDSNKDLKKIHFWIKKVGSPKKFFMELSSIYNLLEKHRLHQCVTRPYWYDEELGIICIGFFSGTSLLKQTMRYSLLSPLKLSEKLVDLYRTVGKWLGQYHKVTATEKTIYIKDILVPLYEAVETDQYFSETEKQVLKGHLDYIENIVKEDTSFTLVNTHNDFSLRNIIVSGPDFGIIDWDAMMHPYFLRPAPVCSEVSFFLINLQSMLRFYPFVSGKKINRLKQAFLQGYFEKNTSAERINFNQLFYIFTMRYFMGIGSDRILPQIYRNNFGNRYIKMLKKQLLRGNADITERFS